MSINRAPDLEHDVEDLIASVTDSARFGAVFDRNFAPVYRYAVRRLGPRQADDIVAETFARAFRARGNFETARGSSVRAWIFGFALNIVREVERSTIRQSRAYGRVPAERDDASAFDDVADRLDAHERLAAALRGLPPEARDLLLLVAGIGLSYKEVAVVLAIPVGTVKSRVSRARAQLVDRLDEAQEVTRVDLEKEDQP